MNYICDYICTSKILTFVTDDLTKLKTLGTINSDFSEIIDYNYFSVWNQLFSQENLDKSARINCCLFIDHNIDNAWSTLMPFSAACISIKHNNIEFFRKLQLIYRMPDEIILFIACRYGNSEIAKEIIGEKKISVNLCFEPVDANFTRSLSYDLVKSYTGNIDTEYMFDDSNKYVSEIFFTYGTRPLHMACLSGNLELVKYLVNMGAGIDLCADNNGEMICAAQFSLLYEPHYNIFLYLHERGATIQTPGEYSYNCSDAKFFYKSLSHRSHYYYRDKKAKKGSKDSEVMRLNFSKFSEIMIRKKDLNIKYFITTIRILLYIMVCLRSMQNRSPFYTVN